ncbi:MAG: ABC transporter permease, partial [Alphaproteobacteria bacterium]
MTATGAPLDERVREISRLRKLLRRPELGAVAGTILIFAFFAIVAGDSGMFSARGVVNFLEVSALLGILAVAAALLMIGGEFDLSIGSMIGLAGVVIAIPAAVFGWPIWACIMLAFATALLVGYVNGLIVVRTGLPSFIVTLAALFILRGLTIGITRLITGRTQVSGLKKLIEGDWLAPLFGGHLGEGLFVWFADIGFIDKRLDGLPVVPGIPMSVMWWVILGA